MQQRRTCYRIEAWQTAGCRTFAIRVLLFFACVAFTAAGAEARHKAPVPQKSLAKKSALAAKKKSVLPVKSTKESSSRKHQFSDVSLLGTADEQELRSELERYIGTRYKSGGTGRGGFDCSGFVRSMYQKFFGIDLPHNARSQFHLSGLSKLDKASLKTGDLIFFSATKKKQRISHVGIYLDEGQFIHAQPKRGVVVSSIENDYWRNRLVSGKRLDNKKLQGSGSFDQWQDTENGFEEIDEDDSSGLQVSYSSIKQSSFTPEHAVLKNSPGVKQQFVELNYVRPVFGKYCSLQVGSFREDFDIYGDDTDMPLPVNDPYDAYAVYSYSQGIRIAGDIKPFQWMSITPSFIYYNHGRELDYFEMPERAIGLDVNLGSLETGWSLSTGLRYAALKSAALRNARTGDPSLLDLSLTCSRRMTDRMQFSFTGQRLRSSLSDRADDIDPGLSTDLRLFFMLNFNY